jgi:predicted phage terminase large subunit-like protein
LGIDDETGAIYVLNVVRGRWSFAEVEKCVKGAAVHDGETCVIRLPQDPGGPGKFQATYMLSKLQGYDVWIEREEGAKANRANPFAAQCEHGMVRLVQADWNHAFVEELCAFRPDGKSGHDDQVDAVAAAFRTLTRRSGGISLVAA